MSIRLTLCADDYAQHAGVDDAVCSLLAQRRITSTSCLALAPRWREQSAPRLREVLASGFGEAGLHLNLTERFSQPQASLPALIARACLHTLDTAAIRIDFERQCDAYEQAMGRAPDFIDGHQHVHQLPQIADITLDLAQRRYGGKTWVRNTVPLAGIGGFKPFVLRTLGGAALRQALARTGLTTNNGFGGVYGFDDPGYGALFEGWLTHAQDGALFMCHPGSALDAHDPISAARLVEYTFLSSDAFPTMLEARKVVLSPLCSRLP